MADNHGYNNCVASGQRSVAVYMLSRVVHDDKNLVVSPVVYMLTLDALCADSDIGSCSVGSGINMSRLVLFEVGMACSENRCRLWMLETRQLASSRCEPITKRC